MPRVMVIANQKGGVGKTTTAINLSTCLAVNGAKTLLIDTDPQGNATNGIGFKKEDLKETVYEVLIGKVPIEKALYKTEIESLDLIPANIQLVGAEMELVAEFHREYKLRNALKSIRNNYEYIIIDSPPSLGLLTVNNLTAADSVIIPIQCEFYALDGLSKLLTTIRLVKETTNPDLEIEGVLMTMFDSRTNLSNRVVKDMRDYLREGVFQTVIPRNVRLAEAPSTGKPIIIYDPRSKGAEAYTQLAKEVIERIESERKPEMVEELRSEYRRKLERWRSEGYVVTKLERIIDSDIETVKLEFGIFERGIEGLRGLRKRLDALDITGFESEAEEIKEMLRNIDNKSTAAKKIMKLEEMIKERVQREVGVVRDLRKFRMQLNNWKFKGYNVSRLESVMDKDYKTVEREFERFKNDVSRLESLKYALESLDVKGYESEVRDIESRLNDPDTVDELESKISELKEKIEGKVKEEKHYTFDNFVVGMSNRFAHAASLAVAQKEKKYNPLFIYGSKGSGKTHLLKAISNYMQKNSPDTKVVYTNGEELARELADAVRNGTISDTRYKYRGIDLLIIDDFDLFEESKDVHEILSQVLGTLLSIHGQVVVSSEKPLKELELDPRVRGMFESGLVIGIRHPNLETKVEILRKLASARRIDAEQSALELIANFVESDIEELENIFLKIAESSGGRVAQENARKVLSSLSLDGIEKESAVKVIGVEKDVVKSVENIDVKDWVKIQAEEKVREEEERIKLAREWKKKEDERIIREEGE